MTRTARAALITGGSSGIGLAVAEALLDLGYVVSLVGRSPDKLAGAASGLGAPDRLCTITTDLARPECTDTVIDQHLSFAGRLDVLVHSAGVGLFGSLGAQSDRDIDLQLNLNLRALLRLVNRGLPHLEKAGRENDKALVAAISSMIGVQPQPSVVPYGITKAAQRALCSGAHTECAERGVQFTAICPALVDTPGAAWAGRSAAMLSPEDIAETVRFLLRTSTACFIPEIQLTTAGSTSLPLPASAPQ